MTSPCPGTMYFASNALSSRLAPRLQPLREAQASKEMARYYDATAKWQESANAFERSLRILRELSRSDSKPAGTDSELTTTLVGYGRSQALTGDFSGAVASLGEAILLSESSSASEPHMARSARQLYWSHIALGDVLGAPLRFSLGRTSEAVEHYRKASLIAEKLLRADPGNDVAKLDLARAFSREAVALANSLPSRSLELLQRSHSLALETSPGNISGLVSRFDYLTSLVEPLVQLGELEKARAHSVEARAALQQIKQNGLEANERSLLKAEAIQLYASGQAREALKEAQRHLALLPTRISPVLSENFEVVQVLERIRTYAAGLDEAACASATERLARIWGDLRATHPRSTFVLGQAERVRLLDRKGCASQPQPPARSSAM